MSVMEFAEVVNPHFAVPVVGVVLCAVLVFAFGFKSSVQPPSFDFEKDKRIRPKTQKKKRPQSNGHVITVETPAATVRKTSPKPSNPKVSTASEKNETQAKTKVKKAAASPKPKQDVTDKVNKKEEDSFVGEWQTAKTRKRKTKKDEGMPKRDDGSDSSPEAPKADSSPEVDVKAQEKPAPSPDTKTDLAAPAAVVAAAAAAVTAAATTNASAPQDAPLEKRPSKKERKKKEGADKQTTTPEATPVPTAPTKAAPSTAASGKATASPAAVVKTATSAPLPAQTGSSSVEQGKAAAAKAEMEKPAPATSKKASPPAGPEPEEEGDKLKGSPKKKAKKKAKADAAKEAPAEFTLPTPEVAAVPARDPIQVALEAAAADEDTFEVKPPARTPKKNRKNKEKHQESIVPTEASETHEAVSLEPPAIEQPSISIKDEPTVEEPAPAPVLSNAASPAKADSSPVSFDELGEWQEAKAGKRKRKPRREN